MNESGSNRVQMHVGDLVQIVLFASQTMMKEAALPSPRRIRNTFAETVLPKGSPSFNLDPRPIPGRGEKVHMVRHDEEVTDKPGVACIRPEVTQDRKNCLLGTPGGSLIRTDGAPQDRTPIKSWPNTLGRRATANRRKIGFMGHDRTVLRSRWRRKILDFPDSKERHGSGGMVRCSEHRPTHGRDALPRVRIVCGRRRRGAVSKAGTGSRFEKARKAIVGCGGCLGSLRAIMRFSDRPPEASADAQVGPTNFAATNIRRAGRPQRHSRA